MLYLTPTQERLRDDIRGLIKGEILCDEITLQLYSTDAGLLQSKPQGIVYPRDIDDVVACTKYAAERGISLHARGAGTGKCGGAIGEGIVLDFSRFMRQIVSLGHDYVVVQPGIVRHRLNEFLSRIQNRIFGPVSGFEPTATIGGILARNGAGANWLRYGLPSDHICELKIVMADGSVLKLDRNNLPEAIDSEPIPNISFDAAKAINTVSSDDNIARGIAFARSLVLGKEHTLADEIYRVLNPSFDDIRTMNLLPPINSAGYAINDILKGTHGRNVDIARLICGSEGTLGLIVEAKLRTVSIPMRRAGVVLFFDSFEKVAKAITVIQNFNPILCELFDRRQLNMSLEWKPHFRNILPTDSEAVLLVELDAGDVSSPADSEEIASQMALLIASMQSQDLRCKKALRIDTPDQFVLFDEFRHRGSLMLFQMRQSQQPLPIFDDLAIPVTIIHEFIPEILNLLKRHEVTASLSGHVGQGHLRITPIIDLSRSDFVQQLRTLANDIYAMVIGFGGSISSDCGDGYLKSAFLPQQYPSVMPMFRQIKKIFDQQNILNTGKIIPDNEIWTQRLRNGINLRGSEHPARSYVSTLTLENNLSGLFLLEAQQHAAESTDNLPEENNSTNDATNTNTETTKNIDNTISNESGIIVTKNNEASASEQLKLQLKWEPERFFEPTYLCNGCGDCLRLDRNVRMCPIFRRHPIEDAAPRSKANFLRGLLEGDLDLRVFTAERVCEISDFCLHCQMCLVECPAAVDISRLVFNCKSYHAVAVGLSLGDLFLSRIDVVLKFAAIFSCLTNWAASNSLVRWLLEKLLHISQQRKFPTLAKISFLTRMRWTTRLTNIVPRNFSDTNKEIKNTNSNNTIAINNNNVASKKSDGETLSDSRKVAIFIDTYLNYFGSRLVELAVRILEHNGFEVYIPLRQRASGLVSFSVGDKDRAERLSRHNTLLLSDLIRQGYRIVALEPASASCIAREYKYVADDIDTAIVSDNVIDFCDFLYRVHLAGKLNLDFRAIHLTVGYHAPCRAIVNSIGRVNLPTPAENILRLIPELDVRRIERGCCGMAGTFGLKIRNYHRSLQIGLPLAKEIRSIDIDVGATDCMACKLQLEQSTNKKILHPITLIAAAYKFINDNDW